MTNSAQQLLTWQRLYEWTEEKEPGAIVGESCTNSSCPLANYLQEHTGKHWSVGPSIRPADGTTKDRLDKPKWVERMIELTDKATSNHSERVTREQFLEVLEQVKDEAEPYVPTPTDEALYLSLLAGQTCIKIQEEYSAGNISDLDTYNRLYGIARKVDAQARKLQNLLEAKEWMADMVTANCSMCGRPTYGPATKEERIESYTVPVVCEECASGKAPGADLGDLGDLAQLIQDWRAYNRTKDGETSPRAGDLF